MARIKDASQLTPIELTAALIANRDSDTLDYWVTVQQIINAGIQLGAGVPASTPDFIGQTYIDTTAKRKYVATGIASSADWDKQPVFKSGTVTVTNGGGDVTVTLPWDWSGGILELHVSTIATDYFETGIGAADMSMKTSYLALTSGSYNDGQIQRLRRNSAIPEVIEAIVSSPVQGLPKSATTTTFVLNDVPGTTVFVKWFVTA